MRPSWARLIVALMVLILGGLPGCAVKNTPVQQLQTSGRQAYDTGQYPEALAKWQQGLELAKQSGDRQAVESLLTNLGVAHYQLGQYEQAVEYFHQALALNEELKNRRGEADNLNNLGLNYYYLGKYDKSPDYFQRALTLNRELKNRPGEADNLNNLGLVYHDLGQYDRTREYYQQALVISRELKDLKGETANLVNLGSIYGDSGQYETALEHYRQALALSRESNNRRGEGESLYHLGKVYTDLGQYDQARKQLLAALPILKETKYRLAEAWALNCLGAAHWNLRQYDQARQYFQQALAIHREVKDPRGEAEDLSNLGAVHHELQQYDQARGYYRQALAIEREIKSRPAEGIELIKLGIVDHDAGQDDQALKALAESLKICQEVGGPDSLWMVHQALGAVQAKLGRFSEAVKDYRQALDTIEGLRAGLGEESKTTFMQKKLFVYDELIDLLRARHEQEPTKGYDRDSLEIFERKQGRLFLEEMGRSGARNFAGLPENVKNRETELENRLANGQTALEKERSKSQPDRPRLQNLEAELERDRTALKALQGELRTNYPDYYALKYPQPAKPAELQAKVLKPGEILLVYAVMKDKTCLWVIGPESFRLQTLPRGEKDLARQVAAYRRTVLKTGDEEGGGKTQAVNPEAREQLRHDLYNLLIPAAVRPALACSRLYIIPTGPLYSLPFETLETQGPGQPRHYFVEDHPIAYLSSASLLKTLREARARRQAQPAYPLLAFANPSYARDARGRAEEGSIRGLQTRAYQQILRGGFEALPETEDEVRAIKAVLQAPEASNPLRVKEAASRSAVLSLNQAGKLAAYRYVVFACHGILPGEVDRVVQPALVLSHPEKDGYLTMEDVFSLKLNADLVSLSACNTGRGSEVKGEGVMGLTRAFMFSGAPAVSVTLWSIESQSARELDVGLFRNLGQQRGRAAALREIKLALLRGEKGEQYRHPFFWAPLVVFGDGQ